MGIALAIGIIIALFSPWLGGGIIVAVLAWIFYFACSEVHQEGRTAHNAWAAGLADRADRQNAAFLRGDPYGLYGEFPPPKPHRQLKQPDRDENLANHHAYLRLRRRLSL